MQRPRRGRLHTEDLPRIAAVLARMGWMRGALYSKDGGGLVWLAFRRWRSKEVAMEEWWIQHQGRWAAALQAVMPAARAAWVATRRLADSQRFENTVLGAVFLSVVLLAADHQPESLVGRSWATPQAYLLWSAGLDLFNLVFNCFFVFDLMVKVSQSSEVPFLPP